MDAEVFLSLGANLGDPVDQLRAAVRRLRIVVDVTAISSLYRTQPLGLADQPDFFNLVCSGRTSAPPGDLLRALLSIEAEMGRRRGARNTPRVIDIDLLAYGSTLVHSAELVLPHPRLHERNFVLLPLQEIAPDWRHPGSGLSIDELIGSPESQGTVERLGPLEESTGAGS